MYRIIIRWQLVASDADCWLECEVELPFPPFAGLALRSICSDLGGDPDELAEVTWDVTGKVLHV